MHLRWTPGVQKLEGQRSGNTQPATPNLLALPAPPGDLFPGRLKVQALRPQPSVLLAWSSLSSSTCAIAPRGQHQVAKAWKWPPCPLGFGCLFLSGEVKSHSLFVSLARAGAELDIWASCAPHLCHQSRFLWRLAVCVCVCLGPGAGNKRASVKFDNKVLQLSCQGWGGGWGRKIEGVRESWSLKRRGQSAWPRYYVGRR
jgi:hypothetical protein